MYPNDENVHVINSMLAAVLLQCHDRGFTDVDLMESLMTTLEAVVAAAEVDAPLFAELYAERLPAEVARMRHTYSVTGQPQ